MKAIAETLITWDSISLDNFGGNTKAGSLARIITEVTPINSVKPADFRRDKRSPTDSTIIEDAKVRDLATRIKTVLGGLNTMKTRLSASSIASFYGTHGANVKAIRAEWGNKGVQGLLELKD